MSHQLQGKKILVIDDDDSLRRLIVDTLARAGATTYSAADGPEGLRQFYQHRPNLVVLDVMMPQMDGLQVCSQLGYLTDVPIILLTALGDEDSVVKGLDCGAIDYITKPFSPKVLLARIRTALRQVEATSGGQPSAAYTDGYLTINLPKHQVQVQGQPVKLSGTEFKLLTCLFENANRVLTFAQILENVWGWEYKESVEYVHVYISHLRRKLEKDPKNPRYLLTEHGIGYRFEK